MWQAQTGLSGGSGGGGASAFSGGSVGGAAAVTNIVAGITGRGPANSPYVFENAGGNAFQSVLPSIADMSSAGGGGAGTKGVNGNSAYSHYIGGAGGDGVANVTIAGQTYVFSSVFGSAYASVAQNVSGLFYVGGGGGGGGWGD